jgi:hypothetical protein
MSVGRLSSGGVVKAPAEGSGPTFVTTISRCALPSTQTDPGLAIMRYRAVAFAS